MNLANPYGRYNYGNASDGTSEDPSVQAGLVLSAGTAASAVLAVPSTLVTGDSSVSSVVNAPSDGNTAGGSEVVAVARTGNQSIDGILNGMAWSSNQLTFSFPTSSSFYGTSSTYSDPAPFNGFSVLSAGQQADALRAFALLSSETGLRFTQVTESSTVHASLRLANSSTPPTAYAYDPGGAATDGDIFYGGTGRNPIMGNFDSGQTLLHEIGHSLGLKHGQETTGYGALPANQIDIEYSLMNYPNFIGAGTGGATASTSAQGYMQDDIAALQTMYGVNRGLAGTTSLYTWSTTTGEQFINGTSQGVPVDNHIFSTVWTAGATSTYDIRNFSDNASLDLRAGGVMKFSNAQLADLGANSTYGAGVKMAQGDVYNALLYQGDTSTEVSALLTGNGNEVVYDNDLYDTITLGTGTDQVFAGVGGAAITGGGGSDTLVEVGSRAQYSVAMSAGGVTVTDTVASRSGVERLSGVRFVQFADQTLDTTTLRASPPVLSQQTNDLRLVEGSAFSFALPAGAFTDPNGGSITYTAAQADGTALPAWVAFDRTTGTFSGTTPNVAGTLSLRVDAATSDGRTSAEAFKIYSTIGNPVLNQQTNDVRLSASAGFSTVIPINAFSNPSTGSLTYTCKQADGSVLPSWVTFDAQTMTLSGTAPTSATSLSVRVDATTVEGGKSAEGFKFLVSNSVATLTHQAQDVRSTAGQAIDFLLPANSYTDPSGGAITYSAQLSNGGGALPAWLSFDASTGHFTGTPPNAAATVGIEIDATTTSGTVSAEAFHCYVQPARPTFMLQEHDQRLSTGQSVSFNAGTNLFTDPAGGAISYSALQVGGAALPAWLSFSAATGNFTGTAPLTAGNLGVMIQAMSPSGGTAAQAFHLYFS